jgi:hypothetical protein
MIAGCARSNGNRDKNIVVGPLGVDQQKIDLAFGAIKDSVERDAIDE